MVWCWLLVAGLSLLLGRLVVPVALLFAGCGVPLSASFFLPVPVGVLLFRLIYVQPSLFVGCLRVEEESAGS